MLWLSPSGNGIKFLIRTDLIASDHKAVYFSAVEYFEEKYKLKIDISGSDVSRLCYVSYDPNLFYNPSSVPYNNMLQFESLKKRIDQDKSIRYNQSNINENKRARKNKNYDKENLKKIHYYLKKRGLSITNTHEDWVRVAFAISNTFNYDFGYKWYLEFCKLDGVGFDEIESIKLINRCYESNMTMSSFATIVFLAKEVGYSFKQK